MSVAIVDYGSGNLHSAQKAFERAAREAGLAREVLVTADPEAVARAEHIVLPGVGAFADCRRGLDWIPGDVAPIRPDDASLKIPHMGWNTLDLARPHPALTGIPTGEKGLHAYFVHSFQLYPREASDIVATASYGGTVTAIVARDNFMGTQFHPEKSQTLGLALIANFLKWRP